MEQKAAKDALSRLKKQISGASLSPLYIFHGSEDYLREHYVERLRAALIPDGTEALNLTCFEAKGLDSQTLLDAAYSMPFMAERRLIIVRDLDVFRPDAKLRAAIEQLFGDPPETACIVFVYDIIEYKPDRRTALFTLVSKTAEIVEFCEQEPRALIDWISRRFLTAGQHIGNEEAQYLIFLCGRRMTPLIQEISKISAYARGDRITKKEIDAVATPVLEAVIFEMTDAIAEKNGAKALRILGDLQALRHEPVMIAAAIGRQARRLYSAALIAKNGLPQSRLMELWGMRSAYPATLLAKSAKKLGLHWCREAVKLSALADVSLKSSPVDKNAQLETLVLRLLCMEETA